MDSNPSFQLAKESFKVIYYRWSLKDFEREIAKDFPLLRLIKSSNAINTVSYLVSLSDRDRQRLSTALVKKSHPDAVRLAGDELAEDEVHLIDAWIEYLRYSPIAIRDRGKYWAAQSELSKADKDFLGDIIRQKLIPVSGEVVARQGRRQWVHEIRVRDWVLSTSIDLGGRYHQITYNQTIGAKPGFTPTDCLKQHISIFSWLGLGGMTFWNQLVRDDMDSAADALAVLCAHFIGAASVMLPEVTD